MYAFSRLASLAACAPFALVVAVASNAAADQDLARARLLDQQGVRAYREERYNDAIRFFDEALKVGGPPSEIWNIAKCHVRLDEPEEATKSIEEYLDQKGLSPADRAEAEQQLHEIQHRHSTLTVASSPPGATVYLEGHRWAGVTPATIDVPPGDHRITIEAAGYDPVERSVTAKYGRALIVDARLSKNDRAPAASPPGEHAAAPGEASPHERGRPHRAFLAAEIAVEVPKYGSIGGSATAAGYFSLGYVAYDEKNVLVTLGLQGMFTGDSWSNSSTLPNTNANCGASIPSNDSATAFSAFLEGGAWWRASPHWRIGGDLGVGIATYSIGEAGRDVFLPTCRPSIGPEPAVHFDGTLSYALSRELRLLLTPVVLEMQPAFGGTSNAPKDATGLWLRYSAAAGLAFEFF